MALTIKYNPLERYASAHGSEIVFTLLEDTKPFNSITYPDYKYICDVYITDEDSIETKVARLKSYPMPSTKLGVFDIGNIVRNYLQAVFEPVPPGANTIRTQQSSADKFYVRVTCRFGEEYGFVTYPDLVIDSQRAYFNHYNGRQFGTTTILTSYLDKVLTTRPYETSVSRNASYCFLPFLPSDDTPYDVEVRCYNKSLGLIRTKTFTLSPSPTTIDELQQLNVAPVNINTQTGAAGTIDSIVDYYTVTLATTNITDDSVYRFNIICEPKYETRTLHFMNMFGGFESKEFTKVSRKSLEVNKSDYGKPSYTINSDGIVSWYNSQTRVYNEQVSVYASEWQEKMQLNTDFLTDAEYRWLGQLIKSPQVYCELDGYFYAVKITESTYEERKVINDRLTNLTINIEFGERFNTQFR